ncbi:hypothetical protein LRH25_14400 [Ideonella azotifigens]|nr:hypothetical protein [Ideonella azotifigens]MCD2341531.1 hypothetical protein [Ideonella azotifigens]
MHAAVPTQFEADWIAADDAVVAAFGHMPGAHAGHGGIEPLLFGLIGSSDGQEWGAAEDADGLAGMDAQRAGHGMFAVLACGQMQVLASGQRDVLPGDRCQPRAGADCHHRIGAVRQLGLTCGLREPGGQWRGLGVDAALAGLRAADVA